MEDLGEQVGRKPACAVGSDLPSGTAPPADSTVLVSCSSAKLRGRRSTMPRTPIATCSEDSATSGICHGAECMICDAGSAPSRMRR